MCGEGEYTVHPRYKQKFGVNGAIYADKTSPYRKRLLKRFKSTPVIPAIAAKTVTSTDGKLTVPQTPSCGKKPGQRKRKRTERTYSAKKKLKNVVTYL